MAVMLLCTQPERPLRRRTMKSRDGELAPAAVFNPGQDDCPGRRLCGGAENAVRFGWPTGA